MEDIREHTLEHRIRFDECDAGGLLRSGGYLRVMQDLAWRHSERLGMGRDWYRANRLAWLVRYADLRIVGEAHSGDTLHVTTRVTGWRRVWARRQTAAYVDGSEVAGATIDWVLIDQAGRPARVPDEVVERFAGALPTFQPGRLSLPDARGDAITISWTVGIRDLDPMRHVNNGTYLDVLDAALADETGALAGPPPPVRYEVEYLRPALPRTTLSVVRWASDGHVLARCAGPDGQDLMRARLTLG